MIEKTKAIVLTAIKYGDADLIVKCYTHQGLKTYLIKRIFKTKTKKSKTASNSLNISHFQPLTQLYIVAYHNNKGNLNSIKEAQLSYFYRSISSDVLKQTIVLFLAEVLALTLKEEEKNIPLFTYIENSLNWLDTNKNTTNFHILFLIQLTKYLGFYPETTNLKANYFDLNEGVFTNVKPQNHYIEKEKIKIFKTIIGIKFDAIERLELNANKRKILLETILNYYKLHVPSFKIPKSYKVLKEVFE